MLHLKKHLGISLRRPWLFSAARFATTTVAEASPADPTTPFAVEDYLVATCGLTTAQAAKASKALSRLKSPSNPDAVLAFLSGLGLSTADIAAAITRDPYLLCCNADMTLAPRAAELRDLHLRPSQIAQLVLLAPRSLRLPDTVSKLQYYVPFFGSYDDFLRALKRSHYLMCVDLDRVVKPNVSCLREWALSAHEISKACIVQPRLLYSKQENVQAMLARAEEIGIRRGTPMFRRALQVVADRKKETITAKMELLKKTFRWSDAQVASAVSRNPSVLNISEDKARRVSEFLISEVGLDPEYIARTPSLLNYNMEGRLMPRHYAVKFLKVNGLLGHDRRYYSAVMVNEKVFMEKFIFPFKEAAPSLAQDYAAACRGEVPTAFRFQEPSTSLASV